MKTFLLIAITVLLLVILIVANAINFKYLLPLFSIVVLSSTIGYLIAKLESN